jgi:hypothetical protein
MKNRMHVICGMSWGEVRIREEGGGGEGGGIRRLFGRLGPWLVSLRALRGVVRWTSHKSPLKVPASDQRERQRGLRGRERRP